MAAEDWIDGYDDYYQDDGHLVEERPKTCWRCGAKGLIWSFTGGRWYLPHDCNRVVDISGEFEVLKEGDA